MRYSIANSTSKSDKTRSTLLDEGLFGFTFYLAVVLIFKGDTIPIVQLACQIFTFLIFSFFGGGELVNRGVFLHAVGYAYVCVYCTRNK
jgi:hypothetical protein